MSRSYKEPFFVDKHNGKQAASKRHRKHEEQRLQKLGEDYVDQPSKAYTNPYDICDFSLEATPEYHAGRHFVKNRNKVNK